MKKEKEKGIEELYNYLVKNKDKMSKEEYNDLKKDFEKSLFKLYSEKAISKEFLENYSQKIKELEKEEIEKEANILFERCPLCGKEIKYCPQCGFQNKEDSLFCANCGHHLKEQIGGRVIRVEEQKKKLFKQIKEVSYVCTNCGSIWKKEEGRKLLYRLVKANKGTLYEGESLSMVDWKNIIKTGFSRYHQLLNELAEGNFQELKPKSQKEVPMILKKDEICLLSEICSLYEPRAVREYKAGFGGVSVPTGIKGVRFRLGSASGTSQSHDEIKEIDQGKLVLTNKRLTFMGRNRTIVTQPNKVLEVKIFKDAIMIRVVDKKKPKYFFISNSEICGNALIGLIKSV